MTDQENVKVFCRVRPPNERERGLTSYVKKCVTVPSTDPLQQTVLLQLKGVGPQNAPKPFAFDRVFSESSTQDEVFEFVGAPITRACLQGYNGTIFAYGQTGSGKTFTMQGPDDVIDAESRRLSEKEMGLRGLVPRVFDYLFQDGVAHATQTQGGSVTSVQHTFACSFLEIYNERVYDLLDHGSTRDSAGLTLRENGRKGVFVEGMIESVVTSAKHAAELMAIGAQNRRVGQTAMNRESSRSHSVFILQIQSKETTSEGITRTRMSRFNLVDLAGSERQKSTEAAGDRLKEAGSINKSLSALGNVIMGLVEQSAGKNRHVHYRDSKLTFLLKDSLGGNSKTFMIATVSPAEDSSHETLSTLKFAQRAKLIRNNAVINEDTMGSVLVLQEEILRLRRQLQEVQSRSLGDPSIEARLLSPPQKSAMAFDADQSSDPATDSRYRELEDAFATSLEKYHKLKRANEGLHVRTDHLQALCGELKRDLTHMRLLLRMKANKQGRDDASMEYEPSSDAIEWRLKFEELEEAYVELQEQVQRQHESPDTQYGGLEGEVEKLNIMLLGLTKQLAFVVRDKHELQDRLLSKELNDSIEDDVISRLEEEMKCQSLEYNARLNALTNMTNAAEEKAQEASLELLHCKQKEAAWMIEGQATEIKIQQLQERIQQAEGAVSQGEGIILQQKREYADFEKRAKKEQETMRARFDKEVGDLMTLNNQMKKEHNEEIKRVLAEKSEMKAAVKQAQAQIIELQSNCDALEGKLEQHSRESAQLVSEKDAKIETLEDATSTLTSELAEVNETVERVNSKLSGALKELEVTKQALETALAEKNGLKESLATLEGRHAAACKKAERFENELSMAIEKLQATESSLQSTSQQLRDRSTQFEEMLEMKEREYEKLQQVLDETKQQHQQNLSRITGEHDASVQALEQSIDAMKFEHVKHCEQLEQSRVQLEEEHSRIITSHEQQISKLDKELRRAQTSLHETKEQAKKDNEEARTWLEALQSQHQAQVTELEERANQQKAHADKKIAELDSSLEVIKSTLAEREVTLENKGKDIARMQAVIDEGDRKVAELSKDVKSLEVQSAQLSQRNEELDQQLARSKEERASMEKSKAKLEESLKKHTELVHEREAEITTFKKEMARMNEEAIAKTAEIKDRDAKLENAQKNYEDLVAQHADHVNQLTHRHQGNLESLEASTSASISALQRGIKLLKTENENLESGNQSSMLQKKKLEEQVNELSTSLTQLRRDYETTLAAHAKLTENQVELVRQKATLDAEKSELLHKLADREKQLSIAESKIAQANEESGEAKIYYSTLADQLSELKRELEASVERFKQQEKQFADDKLSWTSKTTDVESKLSALQKEYNDAKLKISRQSKDAEQVEQSFAREIRELRQELDNTVEKANRQRKKNVMLLEQNDQLEKLLETKNGEVMESEKAANEAKSKLDQVSSEIDCLRKEVSETKMSLSTTLAELSELKDKYEKVSAEYKLFKESTDAQRKKVESEQREVTDRLTKVRGKEGKLDADLKQVSGEKARVVQLREEAEKLKQENGKSRARVRELEMAKIELTKEKEKYKREATILSRRLDEISKQNEKLVGHDNKRQKIQYHSKVKEENNRLLEEVRHLTDSKFKLQCKLQKLELALKEKENLVHKDLEGHVSPASSSSSVSQRIAPTKLQSSSSVSSPASKGDSLPSPHPSTKKRLRTRIE
ncbi:hypothetical protein Poli38472_009199 [Pythium oligandrum]|uniref:Kinesin motor domain-containing protein n=1 Tax=Pythium oligandrum TaxID=41045 RepID=A0A8K1CKA9_PYTOL|nr:hypothetical protein Poli38472_009199 [Pythium oligandrum]|eukprot:TMW65032.1 hypothetical protein Poli38472_009199 [Pythium oligandrum]